MEKNSYPNIPLWVRIETGHDSRLEDVYVLKSQLEEQGIPVQLSKPWHPAYTTGLEFVFELFANLDIKEVILSGLAYDVLRHIGIKIWDFLKSFAERNDQEDFFPTIILRLDDVTIVIRGNEFKSIKRQAEVLDRIAYHIKHLYSEGIHPIDRIEIPCLPCHLPEDRENVEEKDIWRVRYGARDHICYNPATKQLI